MIPCNGNIKNKWWMRVLCAFDVHWHGRTDGGCMGDAYQCHVCGLDTYADFQIIKPIIVHREND